MLGLFDQGTPVPIRRFLKEHTVQTTAQRGWDKLKNGELLKAAEDAGFDHPRQKYPLPAEFDSSHNRARRAGQSAMANTAPACGARHRCRERGEAGQLYGSRGSGLQASVESTPLQCSLPGGSASSCQELERATAFARAARRVQSGLLGSASECWFTPVRPRRFWRACLRRITLRQLALVSSAETSFEALAIARVKSLPSGGKLGRRNWRLRSPRDRQFHSAPATSGEGNAGPTHDVLLPANAET